MLRTSEVGIDPRSGTGGLGSSDGRAPGTPTATSYQPRSLLQMEALRVASWNLHGGMVSSVDGPKVVVEDLVKMRVEIACLQETHCVREQKFKTEGGTVQCLGVPEGTPLHQRYGLGFFYSDAMEKYYLGEKIVSNRIAVLRLRTQVGGDRGKFVSIINAYAPTSMFAQAHPTALDAFYEDLDRVLLECKAKSVFTLIGGDFNSKLGLRQEGEGTGSMGRHGKGKRNSNGWHLKSFLETSNLFAANTLNELPARYRSTWCGRIKTQEGVLKDFKNQIDYVLVGSGMKRCIQQARTYHGHRKDSDHGIVVVTLDLHHHIFAIRRSKRGVYGFAGRAGRHRRTDTVDERGKERGQEEEEQDEGGQPQQQEEEADKRKRAPKVELSVLTAPTKELASYQQELATRLGTLCEGDREATDERIAGAVEKAALAKLPSRQPKKDGRIDFDKDAELKEWWTTKRNIRISLLRGVRTRKGARTLRVKRNKIVAAMRKRMAKLRADSISELASELEGTSDIKRRFTIHRLFRRQEYKPLVLEDDEGLSTSNPVVLTELVTGFYRTFFNPPGMEAVDPWGDSTGPLEEPIRTEEVVEALSQLRNGRAAGPDGMPGELLKYGGVAPAKAVANAVNDMFSRREHSRMLVEGLLIAVNKPGKARKVKFTRAIQLLNVRRKAVTLALLNRIRGAVDEYLPDSQCGFRQYHSTTEVAWGFAWLKALAHRHQRTLYVAGIDMSTAFDTMNRGLLLATMAALVTVTELRLIRALLANTTLRVCVNGHLGPCFTTSMGSPQGDGLSPILFIIYMEGAARELRAADTALYGPLNGGGGFWTQIHELTYADDADFVCGDKELLDALVPVLGPRFIDKFNLKVNEAKTERKEISPHIRVPTNYKKLGAQLDATADVKSRKQKANLAFASMWRTWRSVKEVSVSKRMALYNACVKPMFLYNIACTALTEANTQYLEKAHRRHLRHILRVYYPMVITNRALYRRTNARMLRADIIQARWRFFRVALRKPVTSPAYKYMAQFYASKGVPQRGAPPTLMPRLLHLDLSSVGGKLLDAADLLRLKQEAEDLPAWEERTEAIIERAMYGAYLSQQRATKRRRDREAKKVQDRTILEVDNQPKRKKVRVRVVLSDPPDRTPPTPVIVNRFYDADATLTTAGRPLRRCVRDRVPTPLALLGRGARLRPAPTAAVAECGEGVSAEDRTSAAITAGGATEDSELTPPSASAPPTTAAATPADLPIPPEASRASCKRRYHQRQMDEFGDSTREVRRLCVDHVNPMSFVSGGELRTVNL